MKNNGAVSAALVAVLGYGAWSEVNQKTAAERNHKFIAVVRRGLPETRPLDHVPDFNTVLEEATPMGVIGSTGGMYSALDSAKLPVDAPELAGDFWTVRLRRF